VRKHAKDLGIDLTTVVGSGDGGVITRADVDAALAGTVSGASSGSGSGALSGKSPAGRGETRVPITGVRKHTAAAMVASAFTAPHVTEFLTVDVTRMTRLRARLAERPEFAGLKVSPLLFVARAVVLAARRHPMVNSSWDEAAQEIVVKEQVNLGIAAATPRGLIVPNVKDAGRLTLPELAAALTGLTATAREGRTAPADMTGGTITITNVGVFGVDTGTPILNPGESAILAFGAVRPMPWVHKGRVRPRQVTTLALSFDHRVIDGELGSRFLADVGALLHDPGTAWAF
jgi:2-oxoisovalerate dehydrogenase E2 component (dihydrolipoyl transacylase)